jgi:hypothetical protein
MSSTTDGRKIDDFLIPIVIGVTGHRDLRTQDIPELERKVRTIIRGIKETYTNSPLVVLSPLAEGADRLVANIALEPEFAATLITPVPMPIDQYRKDFRDESSRREFDDLWNRSAVKFELPMVEGNTLESIFVDGPARDRQYAQVGAYIAQHSQILIALWDGTDNQKVAGTAAIVRFKFQGIPSPYAPPRSMLTRAETGPVMHLITPRKENPTAVGKPFDVVLIYPEYWGDTASAERTFAAMLKNVDIYNADARKHGIRSTAMIDRNKSYILPEDQIRQLPPRLATALNRYALADTLAQLYKSRRLWTIRGLFVLVLLGFLFFQVYLEFNPSLIMLSTYPTCLTVAIAWFLYAKRQDYERKHEDYRGVAEAMRVQFFWSFAGIDENVADHYLHKHKGELEWIRYTIRVWGIGDGTRSTVSTTACATALDRWILDQAKFHTKRTIENTASIDRMHLMSSSFFVVGWSLAVALFVFMFVPRPVGPTGQVICTEIVHPLAIIAIVMSLATAAGIQGYLEKLVLAEQSKQYARMAGLYNLAMTRLQAAIDGNNLPDAVRLLKEVGNEALIENGDWILLHRARTLEVPIIETNPRW